MIFWATVLSFLIGIMTYMYYPRTDQVQTVHLPSSEAYIATFVAQHQAAKDYLREALIALKTLPNHIGGSVSDDSVLILSGEDRNSAVDGTTGKKPETPLVNFLPQIQSISTTNNLHPTVNDGFVSVLACFNHPERKYMKNEGEKQTVAYFENQLTPCLDKAAQTKYVLTYGPLPDYSDAPYMRNKILVWEAAILKRTHGSPDCGFLQREGNRYFINTSARLTRTVPNAFMNLLKDYIDEDPASHRIFTVNDEALAPLLFCMTPANDPYPRSGMLVNFDSIVNQGEAGHHVSHIMALSKQEWVNLAINDDPELPVSAEIIGVGEGSDAWHVLPEGVNNDHFENLDKGLTFQAPRSVNTNIPQNKLGNTFTISFRALFREGTYGIFEAENCQPSVGYPCLISQYENGTLSITLKESDTRSSTVSGAVSSDTITQIDYVVNATGHKLFINGKVVSDIVFSAENATTKISDLNGLSETSSSGGKPKIVLGKNGTSDYMSGTLYNFLVYNRSVTLDPNDPLLTQGDLTDAEKNNILAQQERFDVQGLARIHKTNSNRYDYQVWTGINNTGLQRPGNEGDQNETN